MQHRRRQNRVTPTRKHGRQNLIQRHSQCIRLTFFATHSQFKHTRRQESKEEMLNLRVAEKGAIRPCTVRTLACTIPSSVSAPELGIGDVVGR
jgi:hypothetical protein